MSVIANNILAGASGQGGSYEIERSLRFNSGDSAYLSRTPSSSGNTSTFTISSWVKRTKLGGNPRIFGTYTGSSYIGWDFEFNNSDQLDVHYYNGSSYNIRRTTTAVYRDSSAWYHVVLAVDLTISGDNSVRLYVNGTEVTEFSTKTNASTGYTTNINTAVQHRIGYNYSYSDFYLAEFHFIDGQQLAPTDFGEFDTNNVWQAKAYSGTHGTNGFHLDFSDNSSNAALGTDSSGNSNTWTVNNLSVASGAGNDSLVDTPTNYGDDTGAGGEVRGNYCTLNPLQNIAGDTFSDGNLKVATSASSYATYTSTMAIPKSGKWYAELTVISLGAYFMVGLCEINSQHTASKMLYQHNGVAYYSSDGSRWIDGSSATYGATFAANDVIGIAVDADNNTVTFYKNGTSQGVISNVPSREYYFAGGDLSASASGTQIWNFGARPFTHAAPSGYKALCTTNLPEPTIKDSSKHFDIVTYTGDGNSTQTITGLNFAPDLTWQKIRNQAGDHGLTDSVRGVSAGYLQSEDTDAEKGNADNGVSAFNSDGFTVKGSFNTSGNNWVTWAWDAGSSTVSNTNGTLTSQVRANTTAGFSIVTYTGNGTANSTVGHGLGSAPSLVITKARNGANRWWVQAPGLINSGNYLELNSNITQTSFGSQSLASPTSTVFDTIYAQGLNENNVNYVGYCFAPVEGYSKFGSYTANALDNGPFVYTGFRPKWIMIKHVTGTASGYSSWIILDTERDTYNVSDASLLANRNSAEGTRGDGTGTAGPWMDILSNGFKIRYSWQVVNGTSGDKYIFAAFAENPLSLNGGLAR